MTDDELDRLLTESSPALALDVLLAEAGLTVRFGLDRSQVLDIARRLTAGEDWPTVAKAIGWDEGALRDWWGRAAARMIVAEVAEVTP